MNAYRHMVESLCVHHRAQPGEYECYLSMLGGTAWAWGPFAAVDLRWGATWHRMYCVFGWVILRPASQRHGDDQGEKR